MTMRNNSMKDKRTNETKKRLYFDVSCAHNLLKCQRGGSGRVLKKTKTKGAEKLRGADVAGTRAQNFTQAELTQRHLYAKCCYAGHY